MRRALFIVLISFLLSGCNQSKQPATEAETESKPKELAIEVDSGWVDLTFSVTKITKEKEGYRLRAESTHSNRPIGFELFVRKGLRSGVIFDKKIKIDQAAFSNDGVTLFRSGTESDYFLQFLAEQYKQKPVKGMKDSLVVATFLLSGNSDNLESERTEIKIFGDDKKEEDYYEAYINVDLPKRQLELREKDTDYRDPLIRAWSKH